MLNILFVNIPYVKKENRGFLPWQWWMPTRKTTSAAAKLKYWKQFLVLLAVVRNNKRRSKCHSAIVFFFPEHVKIFALFSDKIYDTAKSYVTHIYIHRHTVLSTLQHYILFLLTLGRYIQIIFTYAKNVSLVYKGRVSVFFHNSWPLIAKLTAAGIDKHDNEVWRFTKQHCQHRKIIITFLSLPCFLYSLVIVLRCCPCRGWMLLFLSEYDVTSIPLLFLHLQTTHIKLVQSSFSFSWWQKLHLDKHNSTIKKVMCKEENYSCTLCGFIFAFSFFLKFWIFKMCLYLTINIVSIWLYRNIYIERESGMLCEKVEHILILQ